MNDAASNLQHPSQETEATPQQVADYLVKHPDFLEIHSYLLTELTVKHQSGQSISLVERQVAALREENQQLKQQLASLINTARQNDELFEKSRGLVLGLIASRSGEALKKHLETALIKDFGCSAARLWLLDESGRVPTPDGQAELTRFTEKQHPYCGLLREQEKQLLFANDAEKVGSAAILPLRKQEKVIGLLAIANADKDYYRENMSTSLLTHVGQVTVALLDTLK
jgi:hypothetical protein